MVAIFHLLLLCICISLIFVLVVLVLSFSLRASVSLWPCYAKLVLQVFHHATFCFNTVSQCCVGFFLRHRCCCCCCNHDKFTHPVLQLFWHSKNNALPPWQLHRQGFIRWTWIWIELSLNVVEDFWRMDVKNASSLYKCMYKPFVVCVHAHTQGIMRARPKKKHFSSPVIGAKLCHQMEIGTWWFGRTSKPSRRQGGGAR